MIELSPSNVGSHLDDVITTVLSATTHKELYAVTTTAYNIGFDVRLALERAHPKSFHLFQRTCSKLDALANALTLQSHGILQSTDSGIQTIIHKIRSNVSQIEGWLQEEDRRRMLEENARQ